LFFIITKPSQVLSGLDIERERGHPMVQMSHR